MQPMAPWASGAAYGQGEKFAELCYRGIYIYIYIISIAKTIGNTKIDRIRSQQIRELISRWKEEEEEENTTNM